MLPAAFILDESIKDAVSTLKANEAVVEEKDTSANSACDELTANEADVAEAADVAIEELIANDAD